MNCGICNIHLRDCKCVENLKKKIETEHAEIKNQISREVENPLAQAFFEALADSHKHFLDGLARYVGYLDEIAKEKTK